MAAVYALDIPDPAKHTLAELYRGRAHAGKWVRLPTVASVG